MHLDKLEIKGFKSFKDKTVLEFPDQFTAIVGPNGSGKSNIIDSICFVLGRSRGLRVNNISELICNGGMDSKPCETAKVTMHLSNGADERIKVSREIDRTGKSVYRLDDKTTSRQEILEVMGDNEYNIILQSDVNKVIDMKPKERRRIIDDICGIAEYDSKKEKAVRELEKVEAKIAEVHIITGEKQGYLGELGREREEALRYQELRALQKTLKASILGLAVQDHERRENRLSEKIKSLKEQRESNSERIREIKLGILEKNKELKEINSKVFELEEERGAGRLVELKGEITRNRDRLENLESALKATERNLSEKKERKEAFSAEDKKTGDEIKDITAKLTPLEERIREESAKVSSMGPDLATDKLKTGIFDIKSKLATALEIRERDEAEMRKLQNENSELETKIKESLEKEKNLARTIDDHLIENKSGFKEYESLKVEIPAIDQKYNALSRELEEARIVLAEKKSELKTLERTSDNLSHSVSAVMNLKTVIPGIYGTVSQLGSVSNTEYAKALQIAAGNRLQSLVVDDENTAAKCIEYLKKKKVGRATFLPLSKIKAKVQDTPPRGAIGFARNFITTPFKFEKIFAYVYADTLVVKDIDSAKKIGIGKWRMVSTDGDLITKEGAMTGGYAKDVSIKFSSTEDLEKEIKELEKNVIELDGGRQELEARKKKTEEKITKLEDSVSGAKTGIEKTRLEKDALASRRSEYSQRLETVKKDLDELCARTSAAAKSAETMQQQLKENEKKLDAQMKESPRIDTAILDSLKEEKHALDIHKGRLEEKRDLLAARIKDLSFEIESLGKEQKETVSSMEKTRQTLSELEEKLGAQEKVNSRLMEDIEDLINRRSRIEEEITSLGGENGKIEYELSRINEDLGRQEIEKAKIETKHADLRKELEAYAETPAIPDKKTKELEAMLLDAETRLHEFGSVNMRAVESYDTLKKEIEEITAKLETLKNERQSIYDFMETVEQKKRDTFMEAFDIVKGNFEKIFRDISEGEGTLILDNPREISECGLLIAASPKGKKLLNIDLMSGGEKVLTTSAFLLAIQQYKPSHFYIVDELDAALDKENSARLAEMLSKTPAQFMLITHNDALIKYSQSVIGVSMTGGVSQVVGVKLN